VTYAGFASPLVVLITLAGSVCCALSIGQFAGRVPSAGYREHRGDPGVPHGVP
jgi:amino acid transporter